ncbi:TPA: WXG100 family type VII secretion target [Bacillus toyonensis]|nr:WXG100 family type VII secretion target [Bacillus toyonensis]
MAGQIRMSPKELKSKATRYGQGANQIEDILRQLQNLQNELRGEWEGRAFEGFDQQFNELKPKVQNFAQLLQEINVQLNKTAEAVASHDVTIEKVKEWEKRLSH